jgi:hypothetical protein
MRARNGWMPPEHHDINEIACNSCQGSAGSNFACGKVRAIQVWIATLSLRILPSTISSGTLCLGLIFRYSGELCWPFLKLSGRTSNFAPASVSVM